MWRLFLFICASVGSLSPGFARSSGVTKRSAVTFPPNSVFQVTLGVSVEGDLERNVAGVGLALQHNAPLPNDTRSFFFVPDATLRNMAFYDHLRDTMTSHGFDGLECLKKMICQIASTPLGSGVLEQIINFALTPSEHGLPHFRDQGSGSGRGIPGGAPESEAERFRSFLDSETRGRNGGNCSRAYSSCPRTPLDLITYLETF